RPDIQLTLVLRRSQAVEGEPGDDCRQPGGWSLDLGGIGATPAQPGGLDDVFGVGHRPQHSGAQSDEPVAVALADVCRCHRAMAAMMRAAALPAVAPLDSAASERRPTGPTQSPATNTPGTSSRATPGRPGRPPEVARGIAVMAVMRCRYRSYTMSPGR